jgi:hypothetical protein
MPVVLYTQFKLVLQGYGRDVLGLDPATVPDATSPEGLEGLLRSLPFPSPEVLEATLAAVAREGLGLAALARTTDAEFEEIGVPQVERAPANLSLPFSPHPTPPLSDSVSVLPCLSFLSLLRSLPPPHPSPLYACMHVQVQVHLCMYVHA